ncbi:DUF2339 domain-containing protein [Anaeromyxobacter oryzae]|uniref:DUF2339 domain-containing protein n=1 Tax=Anaeromyxobacter oryzae TaxID=2918170 RepID=A0ABN6MWX6_9BACT|nr:DUF2339 domain-containing protein [Anaeromyxobacter oryzae]BDG05472.1 hypothetical protein AMOR_44680 [Anaeromyxobacter oryzae]
MPDRLSELEARFAAQDEALRRIEERLGALERAAAAAPAPRPPRPRPAAAARDADVAQARSDLAAAVGSVSLVGRTLLVLAGAFVLRALTDAGTLPGALGVALGLAYAGTWIALADRAGRTGGGASAGFHGAAAVMIGFPLVVEAASRFRLLSPALASALLAALTGAALAVAIRRRLQALAWIVTLGGIVAAAALAGVTGRLVPPALYLVALGVGTLWIAYVLDWHALRSPVAAAADLAVTILAFRALTGAAEGPVAALAIQVVLVAAYLGSIATRTLLLGRRVVPFEIVQGVAAIAVGLGGAAVVALRSGMGSVGLGASAVVLGLAAYGVAFAFVERHQQHRGNFVFYASLALLLLVAGVALLLPAPALGIASSGLAIGAAALARRLHRRTLAGHAAAYALVAAGASGLLAHAAEAIVASPWSPWTPAPAVAVPALVAAAATAWLCAGVDRGRAVERLPQLALVAAVAACAAGVVIGWVVPIVAGSPGRDAAPGAVAAVRTAALVAVALGAAWLGRRDAWSEAGWLAVPALAAIGAKILLEDLPRGRPATLVAGFACYGAALILVPRIRRRPRPAHAT